MSDDAHHEIVIIRRGGHGDHDEHHGGVWKIAFADFMTAMMAFFLVMWLISANDKTRASVARYFNPVRLVDATTQPRGLHDAKKDESGITASPDNKKADDKKEKPGEDGTDAKADKPAKTGKEAAAETPAAREKRLDGALRDNPFVALAEIVAEKKPGEPGSSTLAKLTPRAISHHGGEAYRDPFAPPPPALIEPDPLREPSQAVAAVSEPPPVKTAAPMTAAPTAPAPAIEPKIGTPATVPAPSSLPDKHAQEMKALTTALRPLQDIADGPHIDVKRTEEGVLLSLTDTSAFSMFGNGSAVPARKLVLMMERIAKILKTQPGLVIVRGFTDNKPYRGGRYDNWHLSLDRAQTSHYMLVRGGLEDRRIGHVEGYADRLTKAGADPSSPVNRRIEILLKDAS